MIKNWKNLPYWIKGGILGTSITFILFAFSPWIPSTFNKFLEAMGVIYYPVEYIVLKFCGSNIGLACELYLIPMNFIYGFIIGSFLGLIYKKIKDFKK